MSGEEVAVADMFHPGRCRWCGSIYDGGKVEVTARYADCSVWKAPCCGVTADDRPLAWGGSFTPLGREEIAGTPSHRPDGTRTWSR